MNNVGVQVTMKKTNITYLSLIDLYMYMCGKAVAIRIFANFTPNFATRIYMRNQLN